MYFLLLTGFKNILIKSTKLEMLRTIDWVYPTIASSRLRLSNKCHVFGIASKNLITTDIVLLIFTFYVTDLVLIVEI